MENNNPSILCVDDENLNLQLYQGILAPAGYNVIPASGGETALALLYKHNVDAVILDLMMPGMDGYEVLSAIRQNPRFETLPVIVATALSDRKSKLKALEGGASDFLYKPLDRPEMLLRVKNLLKAKEHQDLLVSFNEMLQEKVAIKTEELRKSYIETIHRLVMASEFKDEDTGDHITRISNYALRLAREIGLSEQQSEMLYYSAPMHDIGKIGIPDSVLGKKGPLNMEEIEIMRQHTVIGGKILQGSSAPVLQLAESIAMTHHERWDGTGYPMGLSGEAIPVSGRIVALVDVYDALRMRRPYKEPISHEKTCDIILNGDGRTMPCHFDPRLLDAFRLIAGDFESIYSGSMEELQS